MATIAVIIIALCLRLFGLGWDQGYYLNPDERFLAMVTMGLKLPQSLAHYLNPQTSLLNPYNTNNPFFVYGHFPLSLAKILAVYLNFDEYGVFYQLARTLTAFADTSVVLALVLICLKLFEKNPYRKRIAVYSGLVYAVLVLPIQQAHFFTTDTWVNACFAWALLFSLHSKSYKGLGLSAIFFGLGLASKVTMIYTAPLLGAIILANNYQSGKLVIVKGALYGLISYGTLRLFDPYIWQTASWLDPRLSPQYLANLKQLATLSMNISFPPTLQWVGKGFFFPLKNIFFFGTGGFFFLLAIFGLGIGVKNKKTRLMHLLFGLWVILVYSYLSWQSAKTMRYYLFLYPLFALWAGIALQSLKRLPRVALFTLASAWTMTFMFIYTTPHSRVQASNWMNSFLPKNAGIVWEYWDDPLPLGAWPEKQFQMIQVNFYEQDSPAKWQLISRQLKYADYIVLSSNRLHGTLRFLPELYPQTSRYYQLLLQNKLGFKQIQEFHVYPSFSLGPWRIELPDQWAEEAFTVYDHPQVLIFKKENYQPKQFLKKLGFN